MTNLRIVRGDPSPEDLAAITALLSVAGGGDAEPDPPVRGRWNDPVWRQRELLRSGPGAWRASLR
ncbi:MAG TPA: acyl-CoA carboxylase subunit epsilon [Jatrophihabitans sp.]|jgi:hypothetical protein